MRPSFCNQLHRFEKGYKRFGMEKGFQSHFDYKYPYDFLLTGKEVEQPRED